MQQKDKRIIDKVSNNSKNFKIEFQIHALQKNVLPGLLAGGGKTGEGGGRAAPTLAL